MSCALTKKSKLTFVKDWGRFVLQYLKIAMHQRDPGVIIVNDLPVSERDQSLFGMDFNNSDFMLSFNETKDHVHLYFIEYYWLLTS